MAMAAPLFLSYTRRIWRSCRDRPLNAPPSALPIAAGVHMQVGPVADVSSLRGWFVPPTHPHQPHRRRPARRKKSPNSPLPYRPDSLGRAILDTGTVGLIGGRLFPH